MRLARPDREDPAWTSQTARWSGQTSLYFSPVLYRQCNAIERMFCRLKDFRRIATRYDRLALNYLAAVCIAAVASYWL